MTVAGSLTRSSATLALLTLTMGMLFALLTTTQANAQTPRAVTLSKPDAELNETFTSVLSIRELRDGRVITADARDKLVQIADFKQQLLTKLGREGSGPGEYLAVGRLYALKNDTTLLLDFANNRFLVIHPDGKPASSRLYDAGPFSFTGGLFGVDDAGRLYLMVRPADSREEGGVQTAVRYNISTKRIDTITTIMRPVGLASGARSMPGGMLKTYTNLPLAAEDLAAVTADGRVVVARVADYHLEVFPTAGARIVGSAVAYRPIAITTAERRAFLEKQIRPGSITVRGAGGTAAPMPRDASGPGANKADMYDDTGMKWPAHKPPFLAGALSIDGAGRAWVLRATTHDATTLQYDVFDTSGKLNLTVTLPAKTKLVGFGLASVYLVRIDGDDLQHLQRYPAP